METAITAQPETTPTTQLVPTRHRDDGWTAERQRGFLEELAACGSVTRAAAAVGMSRESAYLLRRRADARAFAQAWDAARALAVEHLTETAWNRAIEGELRQVYYHGELVGERRHFDNRLLLSLIAQNRLAAGPALASPELVAAVAADWSAALDRAERGEPLPEPTAIATIEATPDDIEPPLDPKDDCDGEPLDECQQLSVGCYSHWWDEDGARWLTNWPEPDGFDGEEFWVTEGGEVVGPYGPDTVLEDDIGLPIEGEWARTLTDEEVAGLEAAGSRIAGQRARRLDLYRRSAFGLASAAERRSLAAVNSGRSEFAHERRA